MSSLSPRPPASTADAGGAVAPTILIVDDEKNIRRTLGLVLRGEGYGVVEAASGEEALARLTGGEPIDLAIIDLLLPKMTGLSLVERIQKDDTIGPLPVICISGHATVHDAVTAIKLGARDFFEKPLSRERILVGVKNALTAKRLAEKVSELNALVETRYEMVGQSASMQRLFKEIDRVAPTKASVLITGESGTGKELVSRAIHGLSPRTHGPFVKVNCAAIPRELIESELFGHEKGAFTGAQTKKRGFFEQAHGGTLFLDEIGDMDLAAQAKVLRALQSGEVCRVGSEQMMHVDVRVLAATNKDLGRAVTTGTFREDLFFRLNVFPIRSPSLRERVEDIPALANFFLEAFCRENGLRSKHLDSLAVQVLSQRTWPGNVRELKNAVERAAILSSEDVVTIADLPEDPHTSPFDDETSADAADAANDARLSSPDRISTSDARAAEAPRLTLREYRERAERRYVVEVLAAYDWNISRAAVVLGVERTNLHKKIRAYGIKRGELP
ncbi:MAG: sigma-54-dependent Fis family transcriptional regulator [Polyangiaceae bacterium]|nr:sigma-54-dependent Fis family transcriptional regulator [Polyangiaceae bacterium]